MQLRCLWFWSITCRSLSSEEQIKHISHQGHKCSSMNCDRTWWQGIAWFFFLQFLLLLLLLRISYKLKHNIKKSNLCGSELYNKTCALAYFNEIIKISIYKLKYKKMYCYEIPINIETKYKKKEPLQKKIIYYCNEYQERIIKLSQSKKKKYSS